MDLLMVVLASVALVPLAIIWEGPVRIVLGLIFVLFFPGYTLIAAVFPKRDNLNSVERLALSFGLSIAVVPIIGLILNFTPWGIRLIPILVSNLIFIVVMASISWYRRQRLLPEQRFELKFRSSLSSISDNWSRQGRLNRVLIGLLLAAIVGTIGTLVYVVHTPNESEKFTEFYILGPEGKAENYPEVLVQGEEAKLIVGIVNHEHEAMNYGVDVSIDGEKILEVGPITLANAGEWEQDISFTSTRIGNRQEVRLSLHKGMTGEVYREVHFWIDVVAPK